MSIEQLHRTNRELKAELSFTKEQLLATEDKLRLQESTCKALYAEREKLKSKDSGVMRLVIWSLAMDAVAVAICLFIILFK